MELVLRMAPNHPLSTVTVEEHKRVGVTVTQWRNWLFGVSFYISSLFLVLIKPSKAGFDMFLNLIVIYGNTIVSLIKFKNIFSYI